MLTGKKFPQNLRALRMVVEELLRDIVHTYKRELLRHNVNFGGQVKTIQLFEFFCML